MSGLILYTSPKHCLFSNSSKPVPSINISVSALFLHWPCNTWAVFKWMAVSLLS